MLDRIREGSKGPAAKIILFLIIITFALTGVSGYLGGGADDHVAEVNGEKISRMEFDRAYQTERARMEEQLGEFFNTLAADEAYMRDFRQSVLERLIEDRLATQFAHEQGFRPGDDVIRDAIRSMPEFRVAGQFNNDRYVSSLQVAGFSTAEFRDYMESELGRTMMLQGLLTSEFVLPYETESYQRLQNQRRSGGYIRVPVDSYTDVVEISEEEIENFYYDNEQRFQTDERIRVQYIALDFNDVLETVEVNDAQVRRYYDENPRMFRSPERRDIAHILIEGDDDAARERIQNLVDRIEAGEEFAALAAEYSDDTFSGEEGGNLGRLERGMIDPVVEDAGFALENEGDVSEVVQSEFGFHLVQLTRLDPSEMDSFENVQETIAENLRREQAEQEYFNIQQDMSQISFEQPETLEPAAEQTGLSLQTSEWMGREGNNQFGDARILREIFSADVVNDNLNSGLIELDERSYIVRAAEYEAASVLPLDDVRENIEQTLLVQKARTEAEQAAELLVQDYLAGELADGVSMETFDFVSRFDETLPRGVVNQLFRLPPNTSGASAAVTNLGDGDLAVVAVTGIEEGDINTDEASQISEQFEARYVEVAYQAFMQALKEDARISRNL